METNVRRSGMSLALTGVIGALFFWLTDPRVGGRHQAAAYDLIDRVNEAHVGTLVGVVGSAVVLLIGLWLMTRRAT